MLDLRKNMTGYVSLIGHRGACGHVPENTMISFQRAVELGANIIELDVHLSRDRELVVIHDFNVNRTTNGTGEVKNLKLNALKALDAGSWYGPDYGTARIPTLNEVLDWAKGRVWLAVEIKSGWITYPGLEEVLSQRLQAHNMVDEVLIISFDHWCLKRLKELEPNVATGALYLGRLADPISVARSIPADVMRPHWSFASAEESSRLHAQGVAYVPWGANDETVWRRLLEMDVDALSADQPDALRGVLASDGPPSSANLM